MLGRTSTKTLTGIDQNRLNEQELKTIQLEIQEIETEIEQIQAEQLIQNADILQNSADIVTNAQGIASNVVSIEALEAEQLVQNTSINTNAQGVAANVVSIEALEAGQLVQNTSINANAQNINLNSIDIDDLETRADDTDAHQAVQDAQISTLQTTVGHNFQTLLDELNDIQQQVYGNDADIVALDIRITENRNKINELEFYQVNIMGSLFYNKTETDGLFVALRGTYTVGTIGQLKTDLESLISALDTSTAASIANLQGQINSNDTDISNLQGRMSTEEGQTALQWTAINDLQVFDTSLQNQISGNDTDISTLQTTTTSLQSQITANDGDISSLQGQINSNDGDISNLQLKTQHQTSNASNTFISSNLDVGQTLAVTGTIPENPAIIIRDAANANAMMTMDALSLNAQGNPIIQSNDSSILAQNTNQSGVLVLSVTGPKSAGIRITKDQTDITADSCNVSGGVIAPSFFGKMKPRYISETIYVTLGELVTIDHNLNDPWIFESNIKLLYTQLNDTQINASGGIAAFANVGYIKQETIGSQVQSNSNIIYQIKYINSNSIQVKCPNVHLSVNYRGPPSNDYLTATVGFIKIYIY